MRVWSEEKWREMLSCWICVCVLYLPFNWLRAKEVRIDIAMKRSEEKWREVMACDVSLVAMFKIKISKHIALLHHSLLCASFIAFYAFWTNTYFHYLNNKWENWKLENSLASNTEWKESATRRSKERRFECWNSNCWRCWCPLWFGPSLSVTL